MSERSNYIKTLACEIGMIKHKKKQYEYWVTNPISSRHGKNGYIVIPDKILKEDSYNGILSYVPVHGGITLAEKHNKGMCYGFDTAHFNSEAYPIKRNEWILEQIESMLKGLIFASEIEDDYLNSKDHKLDYAQKLIDFVDNKDKDFNMGELFQGWEDMPSEKEKATA